MAANQEQYDVETTAPEPHTGLQAKVALATVKGDKRLHSSSAEHD
jgi:hypothetical protein